MTILPFPRPQNDLETVLMEAQAEYQSAWTEWTITRSPSSIQRMEAARERIHEIKRIMGYHDA